MKLYYQVATPEVRHAVGTTSYQADMESAMGAVSACGYSGVELVNKYAARKGDENAFSR